MIDRSDTPAAFSRLPVYPSMVAYLYYIQDLHAMPQIRYPIPGLIGGIVTAAIHDPSAREFPITIELDDGRIYRLGHIQECCEDVWLEDINGTLDDMVGQTITQAHCVEQQEATREQSWTFIHLGSTKGSLVLRWISGHDSQYSTTIDIVITTRTPGHQGIDRRPTRRVYQRTQQTHEPCDTDGWYRTDSYTIHGYPLEQSGEPHTWVYGKNTRKAINRQYPTTYMYYDPQRYMDGVEIQVHTDAEGAIIPGEGCIRLHNVDYTIAPDGALILG